MDNSRIEQHELNYSCGAGEARVNLCTGRLSFETPDIAIGANSYTIALSHIYNSHMDSATPAGCHTYAGKGWKLSLQQYMIASGDGYLYIDGAGYRHTFQYLTGTQYYDTSGLGLRYDTSTKRISDAAGNVIEFENGRVRRTVSAVNGRITKEFEYDAAGKLLRVYDGRHKNGGIVKQFLRFAYGSGDLLQSVTVCTQNTVGTVAERQKLTYSYNENGDLISVSISHKGFFKELACYQYDGANRMICAVGREDGTALRFTYSNSSGAQPKVLKVESGSATVKFSKFAVLPDLYFGDDVRCGDGHHAGESAVRITGYEAEVEVLTYVSFDYDANRHITKATDQLGNTTVYNHTAAGAAGEVVEEYRTENGRTSYSGLIPSAQTGVPLSDFLSATDTTFNATEIFHTDSDQTEWNVKAFSEAKKENAQALLRLNKTSYMQRFVTVSAWVRLNGSGDYAAYRLMAVLTDDDNREHTAELRLKELHAGQWNVVSGEAELPAGRKIKSYSVRLTRAAGAARLDMDIADIRATVNDMQEMLCGDGKECNIRRLRSAVLVRGNNQDNVMIPLSDFRRISEGEAYVQMRDLQDTMRNAFLHPGAFEFVYCGGKKAVGEVSSVSFQTDCETVPLIQNTASTPGLYTRLNIDGTQAFKSWASYEWRSGKLITRMTNRYEGIGFVSAETRVTELSGLVTEETDEYGVRKTYAYDAYGNLTGVRTGQANDPACKPLIKHYTYSADGEYLTGESNAMGNMAAYTVNEELQYTAKTDARGDKRYETQADAYGGRVASVREYVRPGSASGNEFTAYRTTDFTYENGRLSGMKNDENSYGFAYDRFGRITAFSIGGAEAMQRAYGFEAGGTFRETMYRHNNGLHYTERERFDRYGRLTQSLENNAVKLRNTYADILYKGYDADGKVHATSAAQLVSAQDDYAGLTYFYQFNEEGKPYYSSYKDGAGRDGGITEMQAIDLKTRSIYDWQTFRNNNSTNEHTKAMYDEKHPIRPRLLWVQFGDNTRYEYEYDGLGRIKRRHCGSILENKYEYKEYYDALTKQTVTSPLVSKNTFRVHITGDISHEQLFDYDKNGNIARIVYDGKTTKYEYDQHNNLMSEENEATGERQTHTYDTNGNRTSTRIYAIDEVNTPRKDVRYDYSGDRLAGVVDVHLDGSYDMQIHISDACGNPVEYNGAAMTWDGKKLKRTTLGTGGEYTYNAYGHRTAKKVGANTTVFHLDGDRILAEDWGKSVALNNNIHTQSYGLKYRYDASGLVSIHPEGLGDNDAYLVYRDATGNIAELYRSDGELAARYRYDAWGNCKVFDASGNENTNPEFIGNLNPFRWKGHYYDRETCLYYINGNYYDPATGRFVNAARMEDVLNGGENLYTLGGNPVSFIPNLTTWMPSIQLMPEYYEIKTSRAWEWIFLGIGVAITGLLTVISFAGMLGAAGAAMGYCLGARVFAGIAVGIGVATYWSGLAIGALGFIQAVEDYAGVNPLKDAVGVSTYDKIATGLEIAAVVGTVLCAIVSIARPMFRNACFVAGTPVKTESGDKKIEDIEVGDRVLAYDEQTGETAYKPVVRLFRNTTKAWYHIIAAGEEIVCTAGHPFYVEGKGFVEAKALKSSDKLLLLDGKTAIIEAVEIEELSDPEVTYNFEVGDFHTYFVSQSGVLVHNTCVVEMQMSRQEAIKYSKEFLGEGSTQIGKGLYRSADGLRTMHFDLSHHPFRGQFYSGMSSPTHINLYAFKPAAVTGRYKIIGNIHIWFL